MAYGKSSTFIADGVEAIDVGVGPHRKSGLLIPLPSLGRPGIQRVGQGGYERDYTGRHWQMCGPSYWACRTPPNAWVSALSAPPPMEMIIIPMLNMLCDV